jgi:hypothetical protein
LPDRWVVQAGLENLLSFFFTVQLHIEYGLSGEAVIKVFNVLSIESSRPIRLQIGPRLDAIGVSTVDSLIGESFKLSLVAIASTTSTGTPLARRLILVTFDPPYPVTE